MTPPTPRRGQRAGLDDGLVGRESADARQRRDRRPGRRGPAGRRAARRAGAGCIRVSRTERAQRRRCAAVRRRRWPGSGAMVPGPARTVIGSPRLAPAGRPAGRAGDEGRIDGRIGRPRRKCGQQGGRDRGGEGRRGGHRRLVTRPNPDSRATAAVVGPMHHAAERRATRRSCGVEQGEEAPDGRAAREDEGVGGAVRRKPLERGSRDGGRSLDRAVRDDLVHDGAALPQARRGGARRRCRRGPAGPRRRRRPGSSSAIPSPLARAGVNATVMPRSARTAPVADPTAAHRVVEGSSVRREPAASARALAPLALVTTTQA